MTEVVVRPCASTPKPDFPDTDAKLDAAPNLADRIERLRDGRDARDAYIRSLLKGCR